MTGVLRQTEKFSISRAKRSSFFLNTTCVKTNLITACYHTHAITLNINKNAKQIWQNLCAANTSSRWQHKYRRVSKHLLQSKFAYRLFVPNISLFVGVSLLSNTKRLCRGGRPSWSTQPSVTITLVWPANDQPTNNIVTSCCNICTIYNIMHKQVI